MKKSQSTPMKMEFPVSKTKNGNYLGFIDLSEPGDMVGEGVWVYFTKDGKILRFTDEEEADWLLEIGAPTVESPVDWEIIKGNVFLKLGRPLPIPDYPEFTSFEGTHEIARLEEVCDCGSHIRHNNGGNYHIIKKLIFRYLTRKIEEWETSTSEFEEWKLVNVMEDYNEIIKEWNEKDGQGWTFYLDTIPKFDVEKLRRKVRDALNKTANVQAIVKCAIALDVKL